MFKLFAPGIRTLLYLSLDTHAHPGTKLFISIKFLASLTSGLNHGISRTETLSCTHPQKNKSIGVKSVQVSQRLLDAQ